MPVWGIVSLVVLGILLLIAAIRYGFLGLFFEIICSIFGGSSGGSSGSSSFGGGDFGGGGSSDSDD